MLSLLWYLGESRLWTNLKSTHYCRRDYKFNSVHLGNFSYHSRWNICTYKVDANRGGPVSTLFALQCRNEQAVIRKEIKKMVMRGERRRGIED